MTDELKEKLDSIVRRFLDDFAREYQKNIAIGEWDRTKLAQQRFEESAASQGA